MSGDYGVDVFAENGIERIAIQAKLYGHTSRRVNRQMIMELYGAAAYFDCGRAVMATNGTLIPDAVEVAAKLGIKILTLEAIGSAGNGTKSLVRGPAPHTLSGPEVGDGGISSAGQPTFDQIWQDCIMPLEGEVLRGGGDRTNFIEKVDWAGVVRISSNGKRSRINIEIFRLAINHILRHGRITRDEINQNYAKRASSGVVLILAQVPIFSRTNSPLSISLK